MMSVCAIYGEDAPSLRFLQGRVTMLPTRFLWLCNRSRMRSRFPPFAKRAKDGAPTMFFCASEVKNLVTRRRHSPANPHPSENEVWATRL